MAKNDARERAEEAWERLRRMLERESVYSHPATHLRKAAVQAEIEANNARRDVQKQAIAEDIEDLRDRIAKLEEAVEEAVFQDLIQTARESRPEPSGGEGEERDNRVWLCAKCGYGEEHGIEGHPAYKCVADMRLVPPAWERSASQSGDTPPFMPDRCRATNDGWPCERPRHHEGAHYANGDFFATSSTETGEREPALERLLDHAEITRPVIRKQYHTVEQLADSLAGDAYARGYEAGFARAQEEVAPTNPPEPGCKLCRDGKLIYDNCPTCGRNLSDPPEPEDLVYALLNTGPAHGEVRDLMDEAARRLEGLESREPGHPCDPKGEDKFTADTLRWLRKNDYLSHDVETIVRLTFRRAAVNGPIHQPLDLEEAVERGMDAMVNRWGYLLNVRQVAYTVAEVILQPEEGGGRRIGGGYQPTGDRLDDSNPPRGGSGVPSGNPPQPEEG